MLKVAIRGDGSRHIPELVNGFLVPLGKFPLYEMWLMDIDEEHLNSVGRFAQHMVTAKGTPLKVDLSTNPCGEIESCPTWTYTPQIS